MVHSGKAKVDATITQSPRTPKGRKTYQVAQDRFEQDRPQDQQERETHQMKLVEVEQAGVDAQGRWLKKSGKLYYGYKRHIGLDADGLIQGVHTTAANEHESKGLIPLLKQLPEAKKKEVWPDKGYKTPANDQALASQGIKNRIQDKGYRNRPLPARQKRRNKLISQQRYKVERTFAGLKKCFGAGLWRSIGMEKPHAQHMLEAIAYNLKRRPGLLWEKGVL